MHLLEGSLFLTICAFYGSFTIGWHSVMACNYIVIAFEKKQNKQGE